MKKLSVLVAAVAVAGTAVFAGTSFVHADTSGGVAGVFTLSGSVSGLYPGLTKDVTVSVTNSQSQVLDVTGVTVTVGDASAQCPASNLTVGSFSSDLQIAGLGAGTLTIPVTLKTSATDACDGVTFPLTYVGTGTVADSGTPVETGPPPPFIPPSASAAPSESASANPSVSPSASATPSPSSSPSGLPILSGLRLEATTTGNKVVMSVLVGPAYVGKTVYFYVTSGLTGKVAPLGIGVIGSNGIATRTLHLRVGQVFYVYAKVTGPGVLGDPYTNRISLTVGGKS